MAVNILKVFENINSYFSPKVIAEVNDQYIKLAKIMGDKVPWHQHDHEDECFVVVEGELLMEIEGCEPFKMAKGDVYVVKKGIRHRVSSSRECQIMLIETKTTQHTGNVRSEITKSIEEQLG